MKNKFKKGDSVYLEMQGKTEGPYTIKNIRSTVVMDMVSFEETSISVGVCYVKHNPGDTVGKVSDYLNGQDSYAVTNVMGEGFAPENRDLTQFEARRTSSGKPEFLFFRPDSKMIDFIVKHAAGRLIIDVGCGSGAVTQKLVDAGARACGIDPYLDWDEVQAMNMGRITSGKDMIQFLPRKIEDVKALFVGRGAQVLLLFCRPCHSDFVYNTAQLKDAETELLYITVPKNLTQYDDLGEYLEKANEIKPEGRSADNEVFYSLF